MLPIGSLNTLSKPPSMVAGPFRCATIFLSCSYQDRNITDAFCDEFSTRFHVPYDQRAAGADLGRRCFPREEIVYADYFLFFASKHSLDRRSWAFKEFELADNTRPRKENRIGIVAVEDFDLPEVYWNEFYDRANRESLQKDVQRIAERVERRLSQLSMLSSHESGAWSNDQVDQFVECLNRKDAPPSVLPLAIVRTQQNTDEIIEVLRKLSTSDRDHVRHCLTELYLHPPRHADHIVQTNSAYLLSRVFPQNRDVAKELLKRPPSPLVPLLFRSYHVGLSFLGELDAVNRFVWRLRGRDGPEWRRLYTFNKQFHSYYYGGHLGALAALRNDLTGEGPANLYPLHLVSLGSMSRCRSDIALIEQIEPRLLGAGTEQVLVSWAKDAILKRSRNNRIQGHA